MSRGGDCETAILQIIPAAPGAVAVWQDSDGDIRDAVHAWALVEYRDSETGRPQCRDVVAMIADDEGSGAGLRLADDAGYRRIEQSSGDPKDAA